MRNVWRTEREDKYEKKLILGIWTPAEPVSWNDNLSNLQRVKSTERAKNNWIGHSDRLERYLPVISPAGRVLSI